MRELSDESLWHQARAFWSLKNRNPGASLRAWMDSKDFTESDRLVLIQFVVDVAHSHEVNAKSCDPGPDLGEQEARGVLDEGGTRLPVAVSRG